MFYAFTQETVNRDCVVHARPGEQTRIGDWVTLGHGSIVHNATIHDWAVIGMGGSLISLAMSKSKMEPWSAEPRVFTNSCALVRTVWLGGVLD